MLDYLILYLGQFTYLSAVIFLLVGSFGFPLPEEIVLLILGYLSASTFINFWGGVAVAILGILLGNNFSYWIFRQQGRPFLDKWGHLIHLPVERVATIEQKWEKHGARAVFISRFMLGFRFLGPVVAGLTKMSWLKFFLVDLAGVVIWVLVNNTVGYYFSLHLDTVLADLKYLKHYIFVVILLLILGLTLWQLYHRNGIKKKFNS